MKTKLIPHHLSLITCLLLLAAPAFALDLGAPPASGGSGGGTYTGTAPIVVSGSAISAPTAATASSISNSITGSVSSLGLANNASLSASIGSSLTALNPLTVSSVIDAASISAGTLSLSRLPAIPSTLTTGFGTAANAATGDFAPSSQGVPASQTLTVSGGVLTLTSTAWRQTIIVNGEGAAADECTSIAGGVRGMELLLLRGDADVSFGTFAGGSAGWQADVLTRSPITDPVLDNNLCHALKAVCYDDSSNFTILPMP